MSALRFGVEGLGLSGLRLRFWGLELRSMVNPRKLETPDEGQIVLGFPIHYS